MHAFVNWFRAICSGTPAGKLINLAHPLAAKQRGGLLIETVVAVSLMTVVGTAVLSGLSTTHISGAHTERQSVAENIARNQMAAVFNAPYKTNGESYDAVTLPSSQSGYSVTATSDVVDSEVLNDCIQRITVVVSYEGSPIMDLETIKSDYGC